MIIPTSYMAGLLLLILTLVCWGSWANTFKMAGKWRYELYYYDFALGALIVTAVAAFTLGSLNSGELTFQDNFLITGYRQLFYGLIAGVVFNLGNMLLLAAISVAGMSVAAPLSLGLALVIGVIWNFALNPSRNGLLVLGGAILVLAAMVVVIFAYSSHLDNLLIARKTAALLPDPRAKQTKRPPKSTGAASGIVLSLIGGAILGFVSPLLDLARPGDSGVAPYGLALLFCGGIFLSTLGFSPFFLNFPVAGTPLQVGDYGKGSGKQHLLGLAGGALWGTGAIASFVAFASPASVQLGPVLPYALTQGAAILAALWGVFAWNEFEKPSDRIRMLLWSMFVLYAAGVAMASIAPLYGGR